MTENSGRSVIQNHSGDVQHSPDNVYGVLGRLEFLVDFDVRAVGILHLNIVPGIDVDFLDSRAENVLCEERKLRHFGVELIHKFGLRQPLNGNTVIEQIFADVPLDLLLYIIVARINVIDPVDHEHGIFARNVGLHLIQNVGKLALFIRFIEQVLCTILRC